MLPGLAQPNPAHARPVTWRAWLLLAPLLAWIALFIVAPALVLAGISFCGRDELGQVVWSFSLESYAQLASPAYVQILLRSLAYAGATTFLCVAVGYPVAWFIAQQTERNRSRLLLLVMLPFWTSFLIRTYAWITVLKSEGLLNSLLLNAGVIHEPLALLYTPGAVLLGLVHTFLPFTILPIYASVEKLDPRLLEAAADLGASPSATFRNIILPLTQPGIIAGAVLVFVPALGMFAVSDLLGGARVPLLGNVIENQFLAARNWPLGAALGVVLLALFAVTTAIAWRFSRRAETTAAT